MRVELFIARVSRVVSRILSTIPVPTETGCDELKMAINDHRSQPIAMSYRKSGVAEFNGSVRIYLVIYLVWPHHETDVLGLPADAAMKANKIMCDLQRSPFPIFL